MSTITALGLVLLVLMILGRGQSRGPVISSPHFELWALVSRYCAGGVSLLTLDCDVSRGNVSVSADHLHE